MSTVIEFNCTTGEQTVREETAEEASQREVDAANAQAQREANEAAEAKHAADKASGETKLADLGLSADEIAALVG